MHAVVITVTIKDAEGALEVVRDEVAPTVSQIPGFVAGYWTRKDDGGLSMVVFESEEQASAAAERAKSNMPEGVELQSVEVREVVASA